MSYVNKRCDFSVEETLNILLSHFNTCFLCPLTVIGEDCSLKAHGSGDRIANAFCQRRLLVETTTLIHILYFGYMK